MNSDYIARFKKIRNGSRIKTANGNRSIKYNKFDNWQQCYSIDTEFRSTLPEYWFINPNGDIISTFYEKPILLSYDNNINGRNRYQLPNTDKQKGNNRIFVYQLVSAIFGIYQYADEDDESEIHHKDANKNNDNANNLQNLGKKNNSVHYLMHSITPNNFDTLKKMLAINKAIKKPSVLFTGINPETKTDSGYREIVNLKDTDFDITALSNHLFIGNCLQNAISMVLDTITPDRLDKGVYLIHCNSPVFIHKLYYDKKCKGICAEEVSVFSLNEIPESDRFSWYLTKDNIIEVFVATKEGTRYERELLNN